VYFKPKNIGFVKHQPKAKCRNLSPIFSHSANILGRFESGEPPEREKYESKT